jgi:hypothetical protein
MHAMLVSVQIEGGRADDAEKILHEVTVPRVKSLDGFVKGYWCRAADGTRGRGVVLFESEGAAKAAADQVEPPPGSPVTIEGVEVFEVIAEA